jgi:hypothetical protein
VLLEGPFAGPTTRRRFEREIELAASLRHPNIVTILDSGLSQGRYFFAMEYIDGLRLDRHLAQHRPPLNEALRLFEKVCDAINFAHQRGVIHRDLKPPNILVDAGGEPHILDFGLAKPVHGLAGSESTVQVLSTSGQLLGTVAYMSPEQASGSQDVDVRTDVYSLGVIFYEALLGQPPYLVEGPLGEILTRIAHAEPIHPRSLAGRPGLGYRVKDELATILLKALEKEPQRRYQTAGDLARDLRHLLQGEPIEAKRASGLYMLRKTLRRYQIQTATAGLMLLMLLGFLVTLAVLLAREREARQRADLKTEEARVASLTQEDALRQARERTAEATLAQQRLRGALARLHVQRGDLALQRSDLREARDSYWQALEVAPNPAAIWALRRYYLQTSDDGTALLTFESHGPSRLSPSGQLAAVCGAPQSIWVRAPESGVSVGWVRTPGPVTVLDLRDDGALAAAGPGWARAWLPGSLRPSVAAPSIEGQSPSAVYAVDRGRGLLAVGQRSVQLCRDPAGERVAVAILDGIPAGPADYAPGWRKLAVPTSAGVELVSISDQGDLRSKLVWTGPAPPRAVRFDDGELLAVLADAVYVATIEEWERGHWTRFIDAAKDWQLFDLKQGVGTMVFATHDGRVAVFRSGTLQGTWTCAADHLGELRLSVGGQAVTTLDDRGLCTRWARPERIEQRRLVCGTPPTTWAVAADGSAALLAIAGGRVIGYSPADAAGTPGSGPAQPRTVLRPRLLNLPGDDVSLAVSEHGRRAVIRDRSTLRLVELASLASRTVVWNHPTLSVPGKVALGGDGELVAVLVRSLAGDQQQIALVPWTPVDGTEPTAERPSPVDLVGAAVRDLAFLPGTRRLLLVRSNGELHLLDLSRPSPAADRRLSRSEVREKTDWTPAPEPWMRLDSPATVVEFNRTGEYLAAACEDNVVRVISVSRAEVRRRIPISQSVAAVSFNPRDDLLLVRTLDGTVRLFDPASGESLAGWALPTDQDHSLAAWIGSDADAMLLGHDGGVYEYRFAETDAVIQRNRAYSNELRVARELADAHFVGAWQAACELHALDPQRGRCVQIMVLEAALRRPGVAVPLDWVDAALEQPVTATLVRLGHAAYDGERFELAGLCLRRGRELAEGQTDTMTDWRIAQCDYVLEAYDQAEAELADVLTRADFDPARAPTAALQRVSALMLAGRSAEARQAALRIGAPDPWGRYGEILATRYASVIARLITGIEQDSPAEAMLDGVLGSLLFQDDQHFFAGEMARQRGEASEAARHYQRCIDLSRDDWPANWARYRLGQLSSRSP